MPYDAVRAATERQWVDRQTHSGFSRVYEFTPTTTKVVNRKQ